MSLADKLAQERRARLAAERLLEQKQAELHAANRKLGNARASAVGRDQRDARRGPTVRDENQRVKSDLTVANEKIQIAERRLWHSIETIEDGFAFFDADSRMIAANHAWLAVFDGLEEVTARHKLLCRAPADRHRGRDRRYRRHAPRGMARADARPLAEPRARTRGHPAVERRIRQADRPARPWRRHGQPRAQHHRHDPLRTGTQEGPPEAEAANRANPRSWPT